MFLDDTIMQHIYGLERSAQHGRKCFVDVNVCYTDWVFDLVDELDIDSDALIDALSELEANEMIHFIMADPGDDFICAVEFTEPENPNQLELFE